MKYISTRGGAAPLGFVDTLLAGLAPDGGLYSLALTDTDEPIPASLVLAFTAA